MSLLDLWPDLTPKRSRSGEYCGPCPWCQGTDRFLVWPEDDRYWCRRCNKRGDSIQFLRDYRGLSYQDAAKLVGKTLNAPKPPPNQRKIIIAYVEEQLDLLLSEWAMVAARKASMRQFPEAWDLNDKLVYYAKEATLRKLRDSLLALLDRTFPEVHHGA